MLEDTTLIKINYILRFLLLIGLIILLFVLLKVKMDSCDVCQLSVENKSVNQAGFMDYYMKRCINQNTIAYPEFTLNLKELTNNISI